MEFFPTEVNPLHATIIVGFIATICCMCHGNSEANPRHRLRGFVIRGLFDQGIGTSKRHIFDAIAIRFHADTMGVHTSRSPVYFRDRLSCGLRLGGRSSLPASTCTWHVVSIEWDGVLVTIFLWIGHPLPLRATIFTPLVCRISSIRHRLGSSCMDAVGSLSWLAVLDPRANWSPVTSLAREKAVPLPRRHPHLDPQNSPPSFSFSLPPSPTFEIGASPDEASTVIPRDPIIPSDLSR